MKTEKRSAATVSVPLEELTEGSYFLEPKSGVKFHLWLKHNGRGSADPAEEEFYVAVIGREGQFCIDNPRDWLSSRLSPSANHQVARFCKEAR